MTPDLYRHDVPESPPNYSTRQPAQRGRITLTKAAKRRAARRGNWAAMPFMVLCIWAVGATGNYALLLVFLPMLALVNISTYFWFLRVERHAIQEAIDQEAMLREARQQAAMMQRPPVDLR
ncbi:MAG TPA: hypothetical protein VHZ07_20900 [Bryobacteraceae bacterium]|nr:hypothetical protein [Bryobacteraceae bacterium]